MGVPTIELPQEILRACLCGALMAAGWREERARLVLDPLYDLAAADPEVTRTMRQVGSVALCLAAHGYLRARTR